MPWLEQRKGLKNDSEEKRVLSEIDSELFLSPFLCSNQGMFHLQRNKMFYLTCFLPYLSVSTSSFLTLFTIHLLSHFHCYFCCCLLLCCLVDCRARFAAFPFGKKKRRLLKHKKQQMK